MCVSIVVQIGGKKKGIIETKKDTEEKTVELFALNIIKAGESFLKSPMDTPFIPTWSRVKSAIPDYLKRLKEAINEDNKNFS